VSHFIIHPISMCTNSTTPVSVQPTHYSASSAWPNLTCLIAVIYRPPNNQPERDDLLITDLHLFLSHRHTHVLIMGDFNCPSLFSRMHAPDAFPSKLISLCTATPLYNHVTHPTRFGSNNSSSLLDLVLTNDELMIEEVQYLPPLGASDHCCLQFDYTCYAARADCATYHLRQFTNYTTLRNLISSTDLLPELSSHPDLIWQHFSQTLRNLQASATTVKFTGRGRIRTSPLRSRTRKWMGKRNNAWINYCLNPTFETWESYRALRNHCVMVSMESEIVPLIRTAIVHWDR
jgi:hypothetical protein